MRGDEQRGRGRPGPLRPLLQVQLRASGGQDQVSSQLRLQRREEEVRLETKCVVWRPARLNLVRPASLTRSSRYYYYYYYYYYPSLMVLRVLPKRLTETLTRFCFGGDCRAISNIFVLFKHKETSLLLI